MGVRGRKSSAPRPVVVEGGFWRRPEPPADLNERQAEIWRRIAATEDPKFFGTEVLQGLLADYCRRRDTADVITTVIEGLDLTRLDELDRLLRMRDREQAAVVRLARALRLTNQSRYQPSSAAVAAKHAPKGRVPWENSPHLRPPDDPAA